MRIRDSTERFLMSGQAGFIFMLVLLRTALSTMVVETIE